MFKLIFFEFLHEKTPAPAVDDIDSTATNPELTGYLKELGRTQCKIGIDDIEDIAHAWGNDHATDLDTFLFLKKSTITVQDKKGIESVEELFRFESKYGKMNPEEYVRVMFEQMLGKGSTQTISIEELT